MHLVGPGQVRADLSVTRVENQFAEEHVATPKWRIGGWDRNYVLHVPDAKLAVAADKRQRNIGTRLALAVRALPRRNAIPQEISRGSVPSTA